MLHCFAPSVGLPWNCPNYMGSILSHLKSYAIQDTLGVKLCKADKKQHGDQQLHEAKKSFIEDLKILE